MKVNGNIIIIILPLTLLHFVRFRDPKCTPIYATSWTKLFGWPDHDTLESKHVAVCIILCNKLLSLNETYILCVSDKRMGMNTVKRRGHFRDKMWTVVVRLSIYLYLH